MVDKKILAIGFSVIVGAFLIVWSIVLLVPKNNHNNENNSKEVAYQQDANVLEQTIDKNTATPTPNSTTDFSDELSKQFFSQIDFKTVSSSGDIVKQLDIKKFSESELQQALDPKKLGLITTIDSSQIRQASGDTTSTISTYANKYADIIMQENITLAVVSKMTNALKIFVTTKNDKQMQIMQSALETSALRLGELSVPPSYMAFHKKNLLFFKNSAILLKVIRTYQEDPFLATLALQKVEETLAEWNSITSDMKKLWL